MPTVEVSRFVGAPPREVDRALSPAAIIEYEGTFVPRDVAEEGDGWVVTAAAGGRLIEARFRFEEREDGYVYRQEGEAGPFESMETAVTVAPEDEGSRVAMRSTVSLRLPIPLSDRVAAWKRRGELDRALAALAADLG